jgi:hypothetical protein
VTSATLNTIGAKNCCLKQYCVKDESGRCAARGQFYKEQLRIQPMAPPDNSLRDIRRASKVAKTQGQEAERERLTGGEHLSQKTTRICPRFLAGQCPRQSRDGTGTGRGRCQYLHEPDEVAATILCRFASTGTACTNTSCKYSHEPPQPTPPEDHADEDQAAPAIQASARHEGTDVTLVEPVATTSLAEEGTKQLTVHATHVHSPSTLYRCTEPDPRLQSHRIDDG